MSGHTRRQAKQADRILARLSHMEIRMSAASDALMKGLADLSAKLSTSVEDIKSKIAEAEAAQAAKDDATFAQANEQVKAMLDSLAPHAEAIGQMASAVAGGAGISAPVSARAADVAPASAEATVQADLAPAAPSASAETADAAPASSSDAPASTEVTGDAANTDGDASAEDAAATKRRRS